MGERQLHPTSSSERCTTTSHFRNLNQSQKGYRKNEKAMTWSLRHETVMTSQSRHTRQKRLVDIAVDSHCVDFCVGWRHGCGCGAKDPRPALERPAAINPALLRASKAVAIVNLAAYSIATIRRAVQHASLVPSSHHTSIASQRRYLSLKTLGRPTPRSPFHDEGRRLSRLPQTEQ
jgi:hypothetical protein